MVMGRVRRVYRRALYEMEPALRDVAIQLYEMRCEAEEKNDKPLGQWAKTLLVCLGGKFAQRDWRWHSTDFCPPDLMYGEWWGSDSAGVPVKYRAVAGRVFEQRDSGWADSAVPAIASWITSSGRMRLLEGIRAAGWENCYYCDTDSIMCNDAGRINLDILGMIRVKQLGSLEVRESPRETEILGIKHYIRGGVRTCAGLAKGVEIHGSSQTEYSFRPGMARSIRDGECPAASMSIRRYSRAEKYTHGIVGPFGRVTPHVLEEF
jgi:hypothetical protein